MCTAGQELRDLPSTFQQAPHADAHGGQRASHRMELELQEALSRPLWVLGTKQGGKFSPRTAYLSSHRLSLC